ncbi:MAG TPA: PEP-CTERM sorting domain-containing protein [Myxococcota bacterium]|nr:PEP-CTERM sorting domain-containing protein [Myxococcota bacterium]
MLPGVGVGDSVTVPEPGALALVLFGLAAARGRRARSGPSAR